MRFALFVFNCRWMILFKTAISLEFKLELNSGMLLSIDNNARTHGCIFVIPSYQYFRSVMKVNRIKSSQYA